MKTYIASWYVNGKRDIALVAEENDELARDVVRVRLARAGVTIDHKIRLKELHMKHMSFIPLSHMGHV